MRAGDRIEIVDRPDHTVTVGMVFRAMMLEPDLMPSLAVADALPAAIKSKIARRADRPM